MKKFPVDFDEKSYLGRSIDLAENSRLAEPRELNRKGQSSLRRLVVNFSQLRLLSSVVTTVVRMLVSLARNASAVARPAKVRIVNSISLS